MPQIIDIKPESDRELVLARIIGAPRRNVWRCWTEAELLTQWFTPPPFTTPEAQLDVRAGGASRVLMRGPDGKEYPNLGVYLEVIPNEKLILTDAYTRAWEPAGKPFMTAILTFADEGAGTRYVARARHWTIADRETHEQMGFHKGWGIATEQLEALAKTL